MKDRLKKYSLEPKEEKDNDAKNRPALHRSHSQIILKRESKVSTFKLKNIKHSIDCKNEKNSSNNDTDSISKSISTQSIDNSIIKEHLSIPPNCRGDDNIDILMNCLMDFKNFDIYCHSIKIMVARLCVLETCTEINKILISENEKKVTEWRAIIKGEILLNQAGEQKMILKPGDTFGFDLENPEESTNPNGLTYSTYSNNCEFLFIPLSEVIRYSLTKRKKSLSENISNDNEQNIESNYDGKMLTTASCQKLVDMLFDNEYLEHEPTFIIDFFLTYKIFLKDNNLLISKIMNGLKNPILISKSISVLQIWINYSFYEFETNLMEDFVLTVVTQLSSTQKELAKKVISIFSKRSLAYEITFTQENNGKFDAIIYYRIVESFDTSSYFEFFINSIPVDSPISSCGLQPYDEIMLLNDQRIKDLSISSFKRVLLTNPVLIFVIKRCKIKYRYYQDKMNDIGIFSEALNIDSLIGTAMPSISSENISTVKMRSTLKKKVKPWRLLTLKTDHSISRSKPISTQDMTSEFIPAHLNLFNDKESLSDRHINLIDIQSHNSSVENRAHNYSSDGSPIIENPNSNYVIKIYNISNDVKYFAISRSDTSERIAHMASNSFYPKRSSVFSNNEKNSSSSLSQPPYFLFVSTITNTGLKNARLPSNAFDLINKCSIGSRYYIARSITELKSKKEIEDEMYNESHFNLRNLNPVVIAKLLSLYDFAKFTKIKPYEYFRDIFKLKELPASENLQYFQSRCNQILIWVQYEILMEPICKNRSIYIRKFIMIAYYCLTLGNFNTFFAICGALESSLISRLRSSWALIPSRYIKAFDSIKTLYNPLNNMNSYRSWYVKYLAANNGANSCFCIPLIPIINKDITFINECNQTMVNADQINYKKIRMLARELRKLTYFLTNTFSLDSAFSTVSKVEESVVFQTPITSILPPSKEFAILLSDILNEIVIKPEIKFNRNKERIVAPDAFSNLKKYHDEFEMCRKGIEYIKSIDTFFPSIDQLTQKSYEYDPPNFTPRKLSTLTLNSYSTDQNSSEAVSQKNKSDGTSSKNEFSTTDITSQDTSNSVGLLI